MLWLSAVLSVHLDEYLRECGVDVYGLAELTECGSERDICSDFLHKVGGVCAKDVCTEQLAFSGFAAELYHSFRLVHGKGFAIGTIEGLVALEVRSVLL